MIAFFFGANKVSKFISAHPVVQVLQHLMIEWSFINNQPMSYHV